jgi:phosphoribosyl-ATP pyrophosphohydrolase/phosphoribosyl-AMP cyclohydrolase
LDGPGIKTFTAGNAENAGGAGKTQTGIEEESMQIDFEKMDGLAPAIVQEESTGEVLMVGFMNAESYARTLETGYVTFYSRTRQKLWMKGETSGNRLRVISALTDCDRDTVLLRVFVEGDGLVCHTGTKSCFTEPLAFKAAPEATR